MAVEIQGNKRILKRSGTSIQSDEFDPGREVRILVLYVGGTIGMCAIDGGKIC